MLTKRGRTVLVGLLIVISLWVALPQPANASLHRYYERPGQVTYRSRQSLRDTDDRAWQAIAFKRWQGNSPPEFYLRLVGFPGAVIVDQTRPISLLAPTGQQWQLPQHLDLQTQTLPESVGQYNLQPLLRDISNSLPLEAQITLQNGAAATLAIAPFIVNEWLQVKTAIPSPPVGSSLGK